jgi:type II restriction/modification system DNA methylase subunit YeeA
MMFDAKGPMGFVDLSRNHGAELAFLNSSVCTHLIKMLAPTLDFKIGHVLNLPLSDKIPPTALENAFVNVELSQADWDYFETSWGFSKFGFFSANSHKGDLASTYACFAEQLQLQTTAMQKREEENNTIIIEAYGLQDELAPEVSLSEITLTGNPHYRYAGDLTDEERQTKLKSDTMRELVSYAIGCMMGRYSLAEPGLIYAHSASVGFDPSRYGEFVADNDGIVPLTEEQWFADDAAARIEEFLGIAWPETPVMETLATLMDGLTMGKGGEPRSGLRAYLSKHFYKEHLQTYKTRPIYWLFSSGKQKAFEALVYLHRYNEGTLARMRTNYVTPLMGKLQQRISDLDAEIVASSSTAEKTRRRRDKDKLSKQLVELRAFDEELRHLADQRIPLDLDEGVKKNYGRFGNLLAFKDKVCGKDKGGDE